MHAQLLLHWGELAHKDLLALAFGSSCSQIVYQRILKILREMRLFLG